MSMPRVFKLFRAMGLRHIVVVNDSNEVKKTFFKILYYYYINIIIYKQYVYLIIWLIFQIAGIVTRKDLARYKVNIHMGKISVNELKLSSKME